MHNLKLLLVSLALVIWAQELSAKHIIGGELQYQCLGEGRYNIIMKVYRDCREQLMAAPFDGEGFNDVGAYIAIYRGSSLVQNIRVPLQNKRFIDAPDYPCLIPPDNLCVEEGVYQFEIELDQWPSDQPYTIVYQRCCRNNTISNIVSPGDVGATFAIEISPLSQELCNSSPVFSSFPPTVVCVDNNIDYDHSAMDRDGDSLVYRFCTPLIGGGLAGGPDDPFGNTTACNGIRPDPPCPPPFGNVTFKSPYTFAAPMAGDPAVKIDPATGLITGTPMVIGQFVMGVCVDEYRDGVLIGSVSRDFQFNVADCDPTVFARVKSDATVGEKEYVINSCGNNTILFENESVLEQYIDTYRWEFDINGETMTLDSRDAEVTFPGVGTYRGTMMVNPGLSCGDTAEVYVNLYPSIEADFAFEYDTCTVGPTVFTDMSMTGAERIESWEWHFGDGGMSSQRHPSHIYTTPGDHVISLTVGDNNQCFDTREIPISYYPVPEQILVEPSSFVGCSPGTLLFDNISAPIDSTYDIQWDFGDGTSSFAVSPRHAFVEPGRYSIHLSIESPIGCYIEETFNSWIEIRESPVSAFSYSPEEPSNFNPTVRFFNESQNHVSQQWIFGNEGRSLENNPTFTFPDTGVHQVALIATHENGCIDTSFQEINIVPRVTYYMPNAFTPNGDGKNDVFIGKGYTVGMRDFELTIWSRWGELLYSTNNPEEPWTGSRNNEGETLPNGVYVYQVKYIEPRGEQVEFRGFATLVR